MSKRTLGLDENLHDYLLSVSLRETPVQRTLREETDKLERAAMRTAAEQAQFLALMLRSLGARRVLEVGTFTGYGTLTMARWHCLRTAGLSPVIRARSGLPSDAAIGPKPGSPTESTSGLRPRWTP